MAQEIFYRKPLEGVAKWELVVTYTFPQKWVLPHFHATNTLHAARDTCVEWPPKGTPIVTYCGRTYPYTAEKCPESHWDAPRCRPCERAAAKEGYAMNPTGHAA